MNGIEWFKSGVTGQHQLPCKVAEMLININQQDIVVIEKITDWLVIDSTCTVVSQNFDQRYGRHNDLDYAPLRSIEDRAAHRAALFYDRFPVRAEDPLALDVRYPRA